MLKCFTYTIFAKKIQITNMCKKNFFLAVTALADVNGYPQNYEYEEGTTHKPPPPPPTRPPFIDCGMCPEIIESIRDRVEDDQTAVSVFSIIS